MGTSVPVIIRGGFLKKGLFRKNEFTRLVTQQNCSCYPAVVGEDRRAAFVVKK